MSHTPQEEPFSEASLNSPEYRERLMRKLNCLIAVLEVATAKVKKSLDGPSADTERLVRIRSNLQSTLDVCLRARAALERREALPKELPADLARVVDAAELEPKQLAEATDAKRPTTGRDEFVSREERRKFRRLAPIDRRMIATCDVEELTRRLQA
jgi:hypothetical protein